MIDLVTNKDIIRMNKVRNITKDFLDKKELEYYKNKDKETEKKIKELVNELSKDMNGCYKAITQSKDVKDIRLIFEYKEIVDEITLNKIRDKFPEYFKESD